MAKHIRPDGLHVLRRDVAAAIEEYKRESYLSIRTPDVLARIQGGDAAWEQMVPAAAAEIIKAENLFGWRPRQEMSTA
jgi:hypothetical protein